MLDSRLRGNDAKDDKKHFVIELLLSVQSKKTVRNTGVDRQVPKGDLPFKEPIRSPLFNLCREEGVFVNRKLIHCDFAFAEVVFRQDSYSDTVILFDDLQGSSPPSIHTPSHVPDEEPEVCLIHPLP